MVPEIGVNIEVYCSQCGKGLCNQTEATKTRERSEPCFRVDPCQKCLDEKYDDGRKDGYDEGYQEGYDKGVDEGDA